MRLLLSLAFCVFILVSFAQTDIRVTNVKADNILKGNYNAADYQASQIESDHHEIICGLQHRISTDSLQYYIEILESFYTRHTYSDTLSSDTGIGAARRWAFSKFASFGERNEDRLIPSYLEFNYPGGSCGDGFGWRNVLGVLPGTNPSAEIIILEAHMDSRCDDRCDIDCFAAGAEDNASGTALVIELARVLSRYTFEHTIVFMLTTGEEQGLYGAEAMAEYCSDEGIDIKAVLNNDIVGAIICGKTSSPPGCPYEGHLDSTHLRIYSQGSLALQNRGLARTVKLYNDEKLKPLMAVPMDIEVMSVEDRTGRGGDHIPFRMAGYTSIRFTSANEHGDANPGPIYMDRQHTSDDIMGLDTNGDNIIDIMFMNFDYLKRNAIINGTSACILGLGPETPEFEVHDEPAGLRVEISEDDEYSEYRVGVRNSNQVHTFDYLYRTNQKSFLIPNLEAGENYFISVAAIDSNGMTSMFSGELFRSNDATTATASQDPLDLTIDCSLVSAPMPQVTIPVVRAYPNPSYGTIYFLLADAAPARLEIYTMEGQLVKTTEILKGQSSVDIEYGMGWYFYRIILKNGEVVVGKILLVSP